MNKLSAALGVLQAAQPTTIVPDYWTAIATVIPVLALAYTVEMAQRAKTHSLSTWQATLWCITLATTATVELQCLAALRTRQYQAWLPHTAEWVIYVLFLALVVRPASKILGQVLRAAKVRKLERQTERWRDKALHSLDEQRALAGYISTQLHPRAEPLLFAQVEQFQPRWGAWELHRRMEKYHNLLNVEAELQQILKTKDRCELFQLSFGRELPLESNDWGAG